MSELTLESLARRLNEKEASNAKDWRMVAGMFTGREFGKLVDEEGRKIREADRNDAREELGEGSFWTPIIGRFSISLSAEAADLFDRFRSSGVKIGTMDLKMACIAVASNALFLTANRRDFEKVPGLRFENWLE